MSKSVKEKCFEYINDDVLYKFLIESSLLVRETKQGTSNHFLQLSKKRWDNVKQLIINH